MSIRARLSDLSLSAVIVGFIAVLVGYTSTAAIIFQAAAEAGASPAQIGCWLTMLGLGIDITSLGLSLWYKMPIFTTWSTPGAALLATSLPGMPLAEAIGVFIFASGLILLCGITARRLDRAGIASAGALWRLFHLYCRHQRRRLP